MTVTGALETRISTRAFLPDAVPRETVHRILDRARWAPSGGNLQPWKVIAVAGAERETLITLARARLLENPAGEEGDHPIYPAELWEPHRTWRRDVGEQMYALLGIPKDDRAGRLAWLVRNYEFFGAPVGLFLVIDRRMGHGQWAHLGMFMQSIALVAAEHGLATCMQEAWARLRTTLHTHFGLPQNEMIYCAIALGHADTDRPVNRLRTARAEVDQFTTWRGF